MKALASTDNHSIRQSNETSRELSRQLAGAGRSERGRTRIGLRCTARRRIRGIRATLGDGGAAGVADLSLVQAAMGLSQGRLPLPKSSGSALQQLARLPITRLGELGTRGPLDRDVGGRRSAAVRARGPFEIVPVQGVPTFPVLWGHDAAHERKLVVAPDSMGTVLPGRAPDAASLWRTASRLHCNRDFQLNSQSLAACLTPSAAIGGRAWSSGTRTSAGVAHRAHDRRKGVESVPETLRQNPRGTLRLYRVAAQRAMKCSCSSSVGAFAAQSARVAAASAGRPSAASASARNQRARASLGRCGLPTPRFSG